VIAASAPGQPSVRPRVDPAVRAVRISAAVICVLGAGSLAYAFYRVPVIFPDATILAFVLQVPLLLLGWWLLRLFRPLSAPPRTWSAAAVIWGATAATGCAVVANPALTGLWAKTAGVAFASNWSAALTAPLNEELLKVSGVALLAAAAPRVIRGPMDGLIIGALTGLGFQVSENVTYSLNAIPLTGATSPGVAVAAIAFVRVVLTTLGSHWAMTAVAGVGIGFLAARGLRRGALPAAGCLATAMGMHLLFDSPTPGSAWVVLLKVLADLIVVGTFYVTLRRGYRSRARAALIRRVNAGVIPASEAPFLLTRSGRRRRQRQVWPGLVRDDLRAHQLADLAAIEEEAAAI
jgi:protease PrsW